MRAVLTLVTIAIILTFVGGVGWVTFRVLEMDLPRLVFQFMLLGAAAVTFVSLATALVVGVYHLYLYLYTDRRPVSLFATIGKNDPDESPDSPTIR